MTDRLSSGAGLRSAAPLGQRTRLALVLGLVVLVVLAAIAVNAFGSRRSTVSGVVVRVNAASLTDVRSFDLRTADGRVLEFEIGPLDLSPPAFNPEHLSVHAATAEPVEVTYEEQGGRLVAVRLVDAP